MATWVQKTQAQAILAQVLEPHPIVNSVVRQPTRQVLFDTTSWRSTMWPILGSTKTSLSISMMCMSSRSRERLQFHARPLTKNTHNIEVTKHMRPNAAAVTFIIDGLWPFRQWAVYWDSHQHTTAGLLVMDGTFKPYPKLLFPVSPECRAIGSLFGIWWSPFTHSLLLRGC